MEDGGGNTSQRFFVGKLKEGSYFIYPLTLGEQGKTAKTIELITTTLGTSPKDYGRGGLVDDVRRYGWGVIFN